MAEKAYITTTEAAAQAALDVLDAWLARRRQERGNPAELELRLIEAFMRDLENAL